MNFRDTFCLSSPAICERTVFVIKYRFEISAQYFYFLPIAIRWEYEDIEAVSIAYNFIQLETLHPRQPRHI
jgi:hypothetical protein